MEIRLKGETYTGKYALGETVGIGFGQTFGTRSTFGSGLIVANDNRASAVLSSGKSVLRCQFVIVAASGGNGVCVDKDDVTYDMLTESK